MPYATPLNYVCSAANLLCVPVDIHFGSYALAGVNFLIAALCFYMARNPV